MSNGPSNIPLTGSPTDETTQPNVLVAQQDDSHVAQPAAAAAPQKSEDMGQKKRDEFLYDILKVLDMLVYVELAAIYYLDISTPFLLLRTLLHLSQLTIPDLTAPSFSPAMLSRKPPLIDPNTPLLLFANIICFAFHLFTRPPSASELNRFHLHGSLLVDFIGQRAWNGWTARLRLCTMDILVGFVQQIACAVAVERARTGGGRGRASGDVLVVAGISGAVADHAAGSAVITAQDTHETSTNRDSSTTHGRPHTDDIGIELEALTSSGRRTVLPTSTESSSTQHPRASHISSSTSTRSSSLSPSSPVSSSTSEAQHSPLLSQQRTIPSTSPPPHTTSDHHQSPSAPPTENIHDLEHLYSGQVFIADLHLMDTLRHAFWEQRNRRLRGRV